MQQQKKLKRSFFSPHWNTARADTDTPEASMSSSLELNYQNKQKSKIYDNSDIFISWNWSAFHYECIFSCLFEADYSLFIQTFDFLLINCQIIFSKLQWNVLNKLILYVLIFYLEIQLWFTYKVDFFLMHKMCIFNNFLLK